MNASTDTDVGVTARALEKGLSQIGLQARAIEAIASSDRKTALDWFSTLPQPESSGVCGQGFTTTNEPYFRALRAVSDTFSAEERASGKRLSFLHEHLRFLAGPEDFQLGLQFIWRNKQLRSEEVEALMGLYSAQMSDALVDDRTWSGLPSSVLLKNIRSVVFPDGRKGTEAAPVLLAFRSYFVKQASGTRCGDSRRRVTEEEETRTHFNELTTQLAPGTNLIKSEEITPAGFGDPAVVIDYLQGSETAQRLRKEYSLLRFGEPNTPDGMKERPGEGVAPILSLRARSTEDWAQKAREFVELIDRSLGDDANTRPIDQFNMTCLWRSALLDIVPEGRLREGLLQDYVRYLVGSGMKTEYPPEWSLWVDRLVHAHGKTAYAAWVAKIELEGDPVIVAYCELGRS